MSSSCLVVFFLLLTSMPMEGRVRGKVQNTVRVSGVNSVAATSNTIGITGDLLFKRKKQEKETHNMPPCCSCDVTLVSVSPHIQIGLESAPFTSCLKPKCPLIPSRELRSRSHASVQFYIFRWTIPLFVWLCWSYIIVMLMLTQKLLCRQTPFTWNCFFLLKQCDESHDGYSLLMKQSRSDNMIFCWAIALMCWACRPTLSWTECAVYQINNRTEWT